MSTLHRQCDASAEPLGCTMPLEELLAHLGPGEGGSSGAGSAAFRAARYHLVSGGKRARQELALAAARTLGISEQDCRALASCVELLHNSSLVFDDLQDRDKRRRGQAAVWVEFGPDVALCAGALLLSSAYGALGKLSDPSAGVALLAHVHERTALLIHGQTADLAADVSFDIPTAEYEQIAAEKSGVLFALPVELAALYAGRGSYLPAIEAAARALAVGYQIADDVSDFVADLAARDSGRLNYVSILSRQMGAGDALDSSRRRSLQLLDEAATLASRVPGGIGAPLSELAGRLARKV